MSYMYVANQVGVRASLLVQRNAAAAGAIKGSAVDLAEFSGNVEVLVNAPVATASDTITFTVQHSETTTDGDFSNVPAAALVNPDTGVAATFTVVTDAVAVFQALALKTEILKRYIRVVATTAGSSIDVTFAAYVIGQKNSY